MFKQLFDRIFSQSDCILCMESASTHANSPHANSTYANSTYADSTYADSTHADIQTLHATSKKYAPILCQQCHSRLPLLKNACKVCSLPIIGSEICGLCLKASPPFQQSLVAFHYKPPIDQLITQLKFNGRTELVELLSHYLLANINQRYLGQALPEAIVSVPLYPQRLRERGFNQAQLLAQALSSALNIPYLPNALIRQRHTPPQVGLRKSVRQQNLRQAFSVNGKLPNHLALVDDVMTTATTVTEISKLLQKSGCFKVDIWCLARAIAE